MCAEPTKVGPYFFLNSETAGATVRNYLHGPQGDRGQRPGRTRARTDTHSQSGRLSSLVEEHGISKALRDNGHHTSPPPSFPACAATDISELTSFAEACASDHEHIWRKPVAKELNGLEGTGTFGTRYQPAQANGISAKWVFTRRSDERRREVKANARLVATG